MMEYYKNHQWCNESNWQSRPFSSSYSVTIHCDEEDWSSVVYEKEQTVDIRGHNTIIVVPTLKTNVIKWLKNVRPPVDDREEQFEGWAMGNDEHRGRNLHHLNIWFYRRRDALNFIKEFSVHKKPTAYYDSFADVRKILFAGKMVNHHLTVEICNMENDNV